MASFPMFGGSAPRSRRLQPMGNQMVPSIEEMQAQTMAQIQAGQAANEELRQRVQDTSDVRSKVPKPGGAFGAGPQAQPAPPPQPSSQNASSDMATSVPTGRGMFGAFMQGPEAKPPSPLTPIDQKIMQQELAYQARQPAAESPQRGSAFTPPADPEQEDGLPYKMGKQSRTRDEAVALGMAKPKKQPGILEMFGYDQEETGMQPLEWLFSGPVTRQTAKEEVANRAEKIQALQYNQYVRQNLRKAGYSDEWIDAYFANQEEGAKSVLNRNQPTLFNQTGRVISVLDGVASVVEGSEVDAEKTAEYGPQEFNGRVWMVNKYDPTDIYELGTPNPSKASGGSGGDKIPIGYYATGNPEQPLAPIKGGPSDPLRSGVEVDPKIIAMETTQSAKWMPIHENFMDIKSQYGRAQVMGARKDSFGDLALTVSLTKMLDPGSVAREAEVEMTQSAAGALQQAAMWGPRLADGKTLLPPEVREQLLSAAQEMYGVYEGAYNRIAQDTQTRLMQYNLSPERVMLGYDFPAPTKTKVAQAPAMQWGIEAYSKRTGIPAEAITDFLSSPSTSQEIKDFNDTFGEDAAEAILKAMRNGR